MRRHASRPSPAAPGLLFGVNPVLEMLRAAPATIEMVWVAHGTPAGERVAAAARALGIRVETADRATLDRLTAGGHHQGVAARTQPFAYASLAQVLAPRPALVVALDGITDPQNLGSIIRSAEVLGAGGLVVPRDRNASVTPAVVRASSGASAHLPVAQVVNLVRALEEMKAQGYWIIGMDAAGRVQFQELPPLEHAVLVVGSEGAGMRPLVLRACDFVVRIPVRGRVGSLNAAIAAGIGLYALALNPRQGPTQASDS